MQDYRLLILLDRIIYIQWKVARLRQKSYRQQILFLVCAVSFTYYRGSSHSTDLYKVRSFPHHKSDSEKCLILLKYVWFLSYNAMNICFMSFQNIHSCKGSRTIFTAISFIRMTYHMSLQIRFAIERFFTGSTYPNEWAINYWTLQELKSKSIIIITYSFHIQCYILMYIT